MGGKHKMAKYKQTKLQVIFSVTHMVEILYRSFPQNYLVDYPSKHNFWRAYYIDRGNVTFKLNSTAFSVDAGHIVFFAPHTSIERIETNSNKANMLSIFYVCPQLDKDFFENKTFALSLFEKTILSNLIKISQQYCKRHSINPKGFKGTKIKSNAPPFLSHHIKVSIEHILLSIYQDEINSHLIAKPTFHKHDSIINSAIEYMHQNLEKKLTVKDIASHIKMSSSNFHAIFKKSTQQSVMDYFNTLKIEQAKVLIRTKQYTISEISLQLGYSSESYFSRQFKKITEMTPSEYAQLIYHG